MSLAQGKRDLQTKLITIPMICSVKGLVCHLAYFFVNAQRPGGDGPGSSLSVGRGAIIPE